MDKIKDAVSNIKNKICKTTRVQELQALQGF